MYHISYFGQYYPAEIDKYKYRINLTAVEVCPAIDTCYY